MSVPFLFGGGSWKPYQIQYGLRLRASSVAYLSRAFAAPTAATVWTWSGWVRRYTVAALMGLFSSAAANQDNLSITAANKISGLVNSATAQTDTLGANDRTGYYHVTWVANGTSISLSVNGALVASSSGQASVSINTAVTHYLGCYSNGSPTGYVDGTLADINFVDGAALSPTAFGMIDPTNPGNWIPINPRVTDYGKNGFRLEFKAASNLGLDTAPISGDHTAANNWAVVNLTSSDQINDTPTNVFPVLDPDTFWSYSSPSQYVYPSQGNLFLQATSGTAYYCGYSVDQAVDAGKWYYEAAYIYSGGSSGGSVVGFSNADTNASIGAVGQDVSGIVIGVAIDCGAGTANYYKNGVLQGSLGSFTPGTPIKPYFVVGNGPSLQINFGQTAFAYAPPTGFNAICSQNRTVELGRTSGTFTGNASASGPVLMLRGSPSALTINSNAVIWGSHAYKRSNGAKIITSSASYNASGSNIFAATIAAAQNSRFSSPNCAQRN